jgi:hypothetical protein
MTLDLGDREKARLSRILTLSDEAFDRLMVSAEKPDWQDEVPNVKRFQDVTTAEMIARVIKRCSMGQEVWWDYGPSVIQVIRQGVDGQPTEYNQPTLFLMMGMPGALLGPAYYVWFVVQMDARPDEKQIESGVLQGMENMAQQKAGQLNGGPLGLMRKIKDNPQA